MNLANKAALKILSISKAIKSNEKLEAKLERPAEVKPAVVPSSAPGPVAQAPMAEQGMSELPPMNETPLDMGMTLGGADSFDSLLGGLK